MFEWFQRLLDWLRSLFWKQELEITLLGLEGAGKTTFVNVLTTGVFHEDMQPTIGFNMKHIQKGRVKIKIWDIAGQPRFRHMWERYCRKVSAIIFMVDSADKDKLETATENLHKLFENQTENGKKLKLFAISIFMKIQQFFNFFSTELFKEHRYWC